LAAGAGDWGFGGSAGEAPAARAVRRARSIAARPRVYTDCGGLGRDVVIGSSPIL
jgi:hypothetical protein